MTCASERADETQMQSLLSAVDAAVWERSRVRQLYRNTLTTDFAQTFQNYQKTFQMLCNEIAG